MRLKVFEQENCGWCVRLHPHVKRLAEDNDIHLEFIDITGRWDIADKYNFRSTPAVMVEKNNYVMEVLTIKPDKGIAGMISEIKEYIDG